MAEVLQLAAGTIFAGDYRIIQPLACVELGFFYYKGTGVEKSASRAVALFQRACDAGSAPGCEYLGKSCELGSGVDKDPARAARLWFGGRSGHQVR